MELRNSALLRQLRVLGAVGPVTLLAGVKNQAKASLGPAKPVLQAMFRRLQAGGPGSGRKPSVQKGLDTRHTYRMLWVKAPGTGQVLMHKASVNSDHPAWFKAIGISYAGPSFDKLTRGSVMMYPQEKIAKFHVHNIENTPNDVYEHVKQFIPPSYQIHGAVEGLDDLIKEHTRLVDVLRKGTKSQLRKEAVEQAGELREYKREKHDY